MCMRHYLSCFPLTGTISKSKQERSRLTRGDLLQFTEESMAFQTKMVANGGLGQETYLPNGAIPSALFDIRFLHQYVQ